MDRLVVNLETGEVSTVPLTEQEIAALPGPAPRDYAAEIAAIERENMLPKATRKFMLSFMEATAIQQGAGQGFTPEQSLAALAAGNPGYAAVKALDNQIEALEAQL